MTKSEGKSPYDLFDLMFSIVVDNNTLSGAKGVSGQDNAKLEELQERLETNRRVVLSELSEHWQGNPLLVFQWMENNDSGFQKDGDYSDVIDALIGS
jgi:hypothetical protein